MSIAEVISLLDQNKTEEALSAARLASVASPEKAREFAAALVTWADDRARWEPATSVYLAALEIAPDTAGAYLGLGRLQESSRDGLGQNNCWRAVARWREGIKVSPALERDVDVRSAIAVLAGGAGEFALAADLSPDDGASQLKAVIYCLGDLSRGDAATYARRAHHLLGERTDTLMALAETGELKPVTVDTMVTLRTGIDSGTVVGANQTTAYLLYQGESGNEIAAVSLAGGETTVIAQKVGYVAALSPDDRLLAYATAGDWERPCDIMAADLATGGKRTIATTMANVTGITWSPDSSHLAVTSREGLLMVGSDGTDRRVLVPSTGQDIHLQTPSEARWSPDGQRIAYGIGLWEGSGPVSVLTVATGATSVVSPSEAHSARWLDNRTIVYATSSYGMFDGAVWITDLVDAMGSTKALTTGAVDAQLLATSPDNRVALLRIGLCYPGTGTSSYRVWACNIADGALSLLPLPDAAEHGLFWATDGTIYYCADCQLIGINISK